MHDNIKIDLKETKCQYVDRIHLNQSTVKRPVLVKKAVKIWVAQKPYSMPIGSSNATL